jgi:hypothetical protein
MNRLKISAVLLAVSACFAPAMWGNNHDKTTILTIAQPLQVQNTLLQPGRYVFKLTGPDFNQKVVSIYNADGMRPAGTVIGSSIYRADPSGKTVFTFSEAQGNQPSALKSWFYPGDNFGVEFGNAGSRR